MNKIIPLVEMKDAGDVGLLGYVVILIGVRCWGEVSVCWNVVWVVSECCHLLFLSFVVVIFLAVFRYQVWLRRDIGPVGLEKDC